MRTAPQGRRARIAFYESHLQAWAGNAAAIGLTPSQVLGLVERVSAARAALTAAEAARDAAVAATAVFHQATEAMSEAGADMIRAVRNFAETSDDPGVYTLAQIPAPAAATPAPPPGVPTDLRVGLLATGALSLLWRCDHPGRSNGTVYEVRRAVHDGPLSFLGVSGVRSFTDDTLPEGAGRVVYQITALRSTGNGHPARFIVNLGVADAATRTVRARAA